MWVFWALKIFHSPLLKAAWAGEFELENAEMAELVTLHAFRWLFNAKILDGISGNNQTYWKVIQKSETYDTALRYLDCDNIVFP